MWVEGFDAWSWAATVFVFKRSGVQCYGGPGKVSAGVTEIVSSSGPRLHERVE